MRSATRRHALRVTGLALLGGLSGCASSSPDPPATTDVTFDRLDVTAVYVADDIELSMPPEVETVEGRHNADLLVLPGDTDADAERAAEWLTADRIVALLGESAESTWIAWARSDTFEETFENGGYSDAQPDPTLLVGASVGQYVKTYRYSWGDEPTDSDVLEALDETLVTVEQETPPG